MNEREEIKKFISRKIKYFEATENCNNRNAELARLRRGVGKSPGEMPELYGIFLKDMPEILWNRDGQVTRAEWSCYICLTLYAVHQQGNMNQIQNVHTDCKVSVGKALRRMVSVQCKEKADNNAEERGMQKLQMLITSKDMEEFSYHLRNIIRLLKSNGVALNYIKLAEDIYNFQFPESKKQVSLAWGQDFYREYKEEKDDE